MVEIVGREEQVFEQWEQGAKVSNPCMKAGDEVVFRNASGATAVMIAREESGQVVVDVPNKLLQMNCNILVDLGQAKEQHSDCQTTFCVIPEQKPVGYKCVDNSVPDTRISFNDLKDRPFREETELLLDKEYNIDNSTTKRDPLVVASDGNIRVTFDGVQYNCVVVDHGNYVSIGNEALWTSNPSDDTGEPFAIHVSWNGSTFIKVDPNSVGTHSFRVERILGEVLDPEYLPGKVVYYWDSDAGTVTDANGNEITVEQAKKDMFNVVIRDLLYTGVYRIPVEITSEDGYVRFDWYAYDGGGQVVIGEQPR